MRSLERIIASLCRKIARERLKKKLKGKKYQVSAQSVGKYLGTPKYRYGLAEETDEIGLATGLAWTEVGGELLQIEVTLMTGSGKLIITGKLGDVMQESAQAALSYVRSRAKVLGLEEDFYQKLDIHVHVPEGAIPNDGPSAGITMATSLVSAMCPASKARSFITFIQTVCSSFDSLFICTASRAVSKSFALVEVVFASDFTNASFTEK